MTKKELRRYRQLERDIETLTEYIKKLEREAERVPVIKDKVQSSAKDWPYIETHVTVDAPEPKRYTKLQRAIIRNERLKDETLQELMRLDDFIHTIPDARGRVRMLQV